MIIISIFWYLAISSYSVSNDIPLQHLNKFHATQARLCYQMHERKRPLEYFSTDWEMIYSLHDVWNLDWDSIKSALNAHPDVYILYLAGFKPDYVVHSRDIIETLLSTLTFSQLNRLSKRINRELSGHQSYFLLAARALEKGISPESIVSFETVESILQKLNSQTQRDTYVTKASNREATKLSPIRTQGTRKFRSPRPQTPK